MRLKSIIVTMQGHVVSGSQPRQVFGLEGFTLCLAKQLTEQLRLRDGLNQFSGLAMEVLVVLAVRDRAIPRQTDTLFGE